MASLAIRNGKILGTIANSFMNTVSKRTLFSPSTLGIEKFKTTRIYHDSNSSTKQVLQENIDKIFNNENSKVFTEDLKAFILQVKTDEDINKLMKLIERYENSNKNTIAEFHFGPQIMRLFYVLNKSNSAIEYFFDPKYKETFNSRSSALLLLNKLSEEKRYDDVINVFNRILNETRVFKRPNEDKISFQSDSFTLYIEALYHKNTPNSIKELETILSKAKESEFTPNKPSTVLAFLLSIKQKNFELAYEISSLLKIGGLLFNLKAIALAHLQRFDESFEFLEKILVSRISETNRDIYVYSNTLQNIQEALEAAKNPDASKKFEELSKRIFAANRLSKNDLTEQFSRIVNVRLGPNRNLNMQNMNNQNDPKRRVEGNRPQNRQMNRFEQGTQSLGYQPKTGGIARTDNRQGDQTLVNPNLKQKRAVIPPPPPGN